MNQQQGIAATATLVHGFTMADVDRAARIAVSKDTYSSGQFDYEERRAIAWNGVVEELYSCFCGWGEDQCRRTEPLTFFDLLRGAWGALSEAVNDQLHHHGRNGARGAHEQAPRFSQYWGTAPARPQLVLPSRKPAQDIDDGFSDHLCERLALRDALGALEPHHYEALATLAAFDNKVGDAADALGMTYHGFYYRVQTARRTFTAAWFAPEDLPATRAKNQSTTCRRGHPRAEHGRREANGAYTCTACKRITDRQAQRHRRSGGYDAA